MAIIIANFIRTHLVASSYDYQLLSNTPVKEGALPPVTMRHERSSQGHRYGEVVLHSAPSYYCPCDPILLRREDTARIIVAS